MSELPQIGELGRSVCSGPQDYKVQRVRGQAESPATSRPPYGRQAVGSHFDPSGSRRKCVLVTNSWFRYFGSVTAVVTTSHSLFPGAAFLRSQPPVRFVVTTL